MAHTLVIHGGAGTIEKSKMTAELEEQYRVALQAALQAGHAVLSAGGTATDAVQNAVRVMEDSPLFNAGKGAVFNHDGHVEMDASIMDGQSGKAGGVTTVRRLRNPIDAARAVMDKSPHVLLCGQGAEMFAIAHGAAVEDPAYFHTDRRWSQLQTCIAEEATSDSGAAVVALDHSVQVVPAEARAQTEYPDDKKFGTVGACAVDVRGNLAAATSTGGMTNKRWGRVRALTRVRHC
jgi:beta-aspartyl-peptidase (threonine type)